MRYLPFLLIMFVIAMWMPSWAQEIQLQVTDSAVAATQSVPPLQPPSILETNTGAGFLDAFLKAFPFLWSAFLGPIMIGYVNEKAPGMMKKIPSKFLPVIAAVVGSLGGLAAGLGSLGLDGGGVAIDTGMAQGGATGATVQGGIQMAAPKIVPVLQSKVLAKEDEG